MKPYTLFLIATILFTSITAAQDRNIDDPLSVSFGVNLVDSSGSQNPFSIFNGFDGFEFVNPFEIGANYDLSNKLDVYLKLSLNKFEASRTIDTIVISEDYNFLAWMLGLIIIS